MRRPLSRASALGLVFTVSAGLVGLAPDPASAAFPGTSGLIAFASDRSGSFQIYAMNSDGSSQARLLTATGNNTAPTWSPSGDRIAFSSDASGAYQIYVVNWGSMVVTRLTTSGVNTAPAWSPGGTKIAFVSNRTGHDEIFSMNADGSSQTQLTHDSADDVDPSWSVNHVIAYASNRTGAYNVFTVAPDGTGEARLTALASPSMARYPDWSPDGRKIAYTEQDPSVGNTHPQIWVMNSNGSAQTSLTDDPYDNFDPSWSPEATMIAFTTLRGGNREIFSTNADGTNETDLTDSIAGDFYPSWQPITRTTYQPHPQIEPRAGASHLSVGAIVVRELAVAWWGFPEAVDPTAGGSLDGSFGAGGRVITDFGGDDDGAASAAIQSDGRIVTAGYLGDFGADYDFALARYNTDGSLDTSFGTGGKVTTEFGDQDVAFTVAIQSDGKIVAAGHSGDVFGDPGVESDFALARYNADGSLDTSFGTGGKVTTDLGDSDVVSSIAIQDDGKIVAAGGSYSASSDFTLARYNTDGSLDTSFGTGGTVTTDLGGRDSAGSVAIDPTGKLVVAGVGGGFFTSNFALARYNTDGSLDTSFGSDGKVTTYLGPTRATSESGAEEVAIQSDGKIVAAGHVGTTDRSDFALARYNTDGSLDASFGSDGKVTTDLGESDRALSVGIQSDGKIVTAGGSGNTRADPALDPDFSDFALARYNADGSLDASFGSDGKVTTDLEGDEAAFFVAIQPDGRIVVPGYTGFGNNYDFVLVRYLGAPDQP